MIIICTAQEKQHLIQRLSPENGSCADCPVFETCATYTTCEKALEKGIEWIEETKIKIAI